MSDNMETTKLVSLIDSLDDNIDELEEALEPLLKTALSDTAGRLPLLDKAQLYVLVTYAIESLLFSYLRLNGVNSKEHPVFRELSRVKQYFEKIKAAETAGNKQNVTLNKAAAGRFIRYALAGNKKLDLDLGKQIGNENAATHTRFEELPGRQISNDPRNRSRTVSLSDDPDFSSEHMESSDGPALEMMRGQRTSDRRVSDDEPEIKVKLGLDLSSGMASNKSLANGDSIGGLRRKKKMEKKKLSKKARMLE